MFVDTAIFAGLFFGSDLLGIPSTRKTTTEGEEKTFKELHRLGNPSYNNTTDDVIEELQ